MPGCPLRRIFFACRRQNYGYPVSPAATKTHVLKDLKKKSPRNYIRSFGYVDLEPEFSYLLIYGLPQAHGIMERKQLAANILCSHSDARSIR
jgi:hypothetical protein